MWIHILPLSITCIFNRLHLYLDMFWQNNFGSVVRYPFVVKWLGRAKKDRQNVVSVDRVHMKLMTSTSPSHLNGLALL